MPTPVDSEYNAISCEGHFEVWEDGYAYMSEADCQKEYNSNEVFAECLDNAWAINHEGAPKTFPTGYVEKGAESYVKCKTLYGAWNLSAPLGI